MSGVGGKAPVETEELEKASGIRGDRKLWK